MKIRFTLFIILPLFFVSCVSNKKHRTTIAQLNTRHQAKTDSLKNLLDTAQNKVYQLELNVAERQGENNILILLRNELQDEIVRLESNIEKLSNTSTSAQKNLSADLEKKEIQIKTLKDYLNEIGTAIKDYEDNIKNITSDLNLIAQDFPEDIEVALGSDYAILELRETFLFKKNSATRLENNGNLILEKFAAIFQNYPNIKVQVVGHTDTSPPRDKRRYRDNWNFSALQSATVVRTLIDEYDVSANQLTLAAKAEFAPKASNATPEGKLKNRRIELFITMDLEDLTKKIQKTLDKVE